MLVKMAEIPKAIYMFNTTSIKIPVMLLTEIEKSTLKFI
jgi:predicted ribonuclease YlaK